MSHNLDRNPRYHPVLFPAILLVCSVTLGIASVSADNVFPVLAFFGVPTDLFGLSIALVLAIVAILVVIISLIERFDRRPSRPVHRVSTAKGVVL